MLAYPAAKNDAEYGPDEREPQKEPHSDDFGGPVRQLVAAEDVGGDESQKKCGQYGVSRDTGRGRLGWRMDMRVAGGCTWRCSDD